MRRQLCSPRSTVFKKFFEFTLPAVRMYVRTKEVKGEEGLHTDHSHVRWHAGLRTERPGIQGLPHFKLFTKNVTREEQDVGDEAYLVHGSR